MCGIAGWIGAPPDEGTASRLAALLRHRGPDGEGTRSWPDATLVHRRLSILDQSPAGAQPMSNESAEVWSVVNGEIYNHHELRRWLTERGHRFRGRCDAEVVPRLYEEKGPAFVEDLRGMFALALYDTRRRLLLLARDRFGIKPLFYTPGTDRVSFASEITALRAVPGVDQEPDRQAVYDAAALLYVPAPATAFRGIRAVCPGEVVEIRREGDGLCSSSRNYASWQIAPDDSLDAAFAVERIDELVTRAVGEQLESDVPLGSFLSGGIDSSIVSAAARRVAHDLKTFNVRFRERDYDETWAALAVAQHVTSDHRILEMDDEPGTWDRVIDLLGHVGQPFGDTSLVPSSAVCRLIRDHVTVALSGDGGDEGFGGYPTFAQIGKIARARRVPSFFPRVLRTLSRPFVADATTAGRWLRRMDEVQTQDDVAVVQDQLSWVRPTEHAAWCLDRDRLPVRRHFEPKWEHLLPPRASPLERVSALLSEATIRLTMANDFLFKVDTASMRESLEVRVPLLNEDLVAFGLRLPHRLKVKGPVPKRLLRELARRWLPQAVADKPKMGFAMPIDRWVDESFRERLRDTLLGPQSVLPEFFHESAYEPAVQAFCEERTLPGNSRAGAYTRVFFLLSLQVTLAPGTVGRDVGSASAPAEARGR